MLSAGFRHHTLIVSLAALWIIALLWLIRRFVEGGGLAFVIKRLVDVIPWLSFDHRNRQIKRRQKCVACGIGGKKDLRYDPVEHMVLVQCPVCLATWGYDPIVKTQKWDAAIREQ